MPGVTERIPNIRTVTPKTSADCLTFSPLSLQFWINENSSQQAAALVYSVILFTNRPERSRPSDQIHRIAELQCCAGPQFLRWASETVLPSAPDLAQPPSGPLDGWHRPSRARVYRR